ncbi:secreted RxLR effector protein 161-like [Teleopsis dalmanni]|uniref:secreted RxLR effector protein 161-like n=1 Tax=Teleopsis dalmanni TaxID=139649 RepID=UPI0018CDD0C5|nr:secreted RxLR effector protein 161-like [Teleopsis dalmanni]
MGKHFSKSTIDGPKAKFPYREAIGSLMYLMVCTRPDITCAIGVLSRFLENPFEIHCQGVKRVFRYIKGTLEYGVSFNLNSSDTELVMYCDADWGNDSDTRRSISAWIAFINGGPVSWSSRRQSVTATSTTEAEFLSICAATKAVVWLRKLTSDVNCKQYGATIINCDNQKAIELVKNPDSSKRTKHIAIQYFYACDMQATGEIDMKYVESNKQLADALTKSLSKIKFEMLISQYGLAKVCNKKSEKEC